MFNEYMENFKDGSNIPQDDMFPFLPDNVDIFSILELIGISLILIFNYRLGYKSFF